MRSWQFVALATLTLGCSGGRDPVRTIGGDGEYAGPGSGDPYGGSLGESPGNPTATSTLVALCTNACAHLHAADCDAAPAHTTDQCEPQCQGEAASIVGPCADESAAIYACMIGAKITCPTDVTSQPVVAGCDSEKNALTQCIAPGSGCTPSPASDDICPSISLGLHHFFTCSAGTTPPPGCVSVSQEAACCP